jgi:hypothetical protein
VLRHGHALTLYCYRPPEGVPSGVTLRDAATIIPEAEIIRHHSGSVALFSDRFRYELQRRGCGTWLDADIYLLGTLDGTSRYLFGRQDQIVNVAVLRLPQDSPILDDLIGLFDEKCVPPWLTFRSRAAARWRLLTSGRAGLAKMPWGTAGPHGFTALLRRHGLDHHALPEQVFYAVRWQDAAWLRDPARRLEDMISPSTVALHLWNDCIQSFKNEPAPAGSFLARLQHEGRLA